MLDRRVFLLDDVHQPDYPAFVTRDGKTHRVGGGIIGEMIAAAPRVTAVAQIALNGFGRVKQLFRTRQAGSVIRIA